MSIQTKLSRSSARSTSRCRFRKQSSLSRSSPSCVGLTEICARRPGGLHLVEHVEIVQRDLLGVLDARQVLAELREDGADALRLLRRRRGHRVLEALARHEGRHRPANERRPRRALAQPRVGGHREQDLAGDAHSRSLDQPAVHLQRRAGDVGGGVGEQKRAGAAELVRLRRSDRAESRRRRAAAAPPA